MRSSGARPFVIGIDGGGTSTRIVFADPDGRELARRTGPPGLVEPGDPASTAAQLVSLVRETAEQAGLALPAAALCAGLAGVGAPDPREAVRAVLERAGLTVPGRVLVVEDGEIALEGALGGEAGVLLAAGTGSVAYGRAADGRVARCGGWGRFVGDEGSAWALGRDALRAALRAADGRGPETLLLPELMAALGLADPRGVPPWVGRAEKGEVAALAPVVLRTAAAGDPVAAAVVHDAAGELALHVRALIERLGPWSGSVPLVLQGGLVADTALVRLLRERLEDVPVQPRPAAADPVTGAARLAAAAAA